MKSNIMVLAAVVLVVCYLSGCAKSGTEDLSQAEKVLAPYVTQLENRYNTEYKDLKDKNVKLEKDYNDLLTQYAAMQKQVSDSQKAAGLAQSELASYKKQYSDLASQAGAAQSALANMTNERALFEQRYLQSQVEVARLQSQLNTSQADYNELYAKISKVNSHTDPTVNGYTTAQQSNFYLIWNKWWDVVITNG